MTHITSRPCYVLCDLDNLLWRCSGVVIGKFDIPEPFSSIRIVPKPKVFTEFITYKIRAKEGIKMYKHATIEALAK